MPIPQVMARVLSNNKLTDKIYETVIEMIDPPQLEFKAGQHFIFEINMRAVRQYSISSAPQVKNKFELVVDISPRGPGSLYIESLKAGDVIKTRGPWGRFVMKEPMAQNLVFVATGVGVTPLKSMIEDLYNRRNEIWHQSGTTGLLDRIKSGLGLSAKPANIELYFGVRHEADIFYFDLFEKIAKEWPQFKFYPTLSRPEGKWTGMTGRVTDHLSKRTFDGAKTQAYLCGSGQMIADVKRLLVEKGLPENNVHFEKFYA